MNKKIILMFLVLIVSGCSAIGKDAAASCPLTEPVWIKPPEDAAVSNPPEFGYYYSNGDNSILASAWWFGQEDYPLRADSNGVKVGWFRPEGTELTITAQRLDGEAPEFDAHVPCCYPTRFQATGLYFPTEGCWEVNAKAADKEITFIVWVEP